MDEDDVYYLTAADVEMLRMVMSTRIKELDYSEFFVEEDDE